MIRQKPVSTLLYCWHFTDMTDRTLALHWHASSCLQWRVCRHFNITSGAWHFPRHANTYFQWQDCQHFTWHIIKHLTFHFTNMPALVFSGMTVSTSTDMTGGNWHFTDVSALVFNSSMTLHIYLHFLSLNDMMTLHRHAVISPTRPSALQWHDREHIPSLTPIAQEREERRKTRRRNKLSVNKK